MPKPLAWLVIVGLVLTSGWLVWDTWTRDGLTGLAGGAMVITLALVAGLLFLALWHLAGVSVGRLLAWLFPRPPTWLQPRAVHEFTDRNDFRSLIERLDLIDETPGSRVSLLRDRHTRQLWQQTWLDIGHTSARLLIPTDKQTSSDDKDKAPD